MRDVIITDENIWIFFTLNYLSRAFLEHLENSFLCRLNLVFFFCNFFHIQINYELGTHGNGDE